ncbi:helix-turn-helix transcriptional regulator [Streptomyces drozdowiczii]|uniref:Helix-turn-helix transcriptional regulator n=1 Tax=Streptomyces drozdowiczii TaxID=202862 RepID=A0ABY6PLP2_9ACTN|nr:helix-turn-helix transcriptional regulator [Streptomyces drozdowiczii]MCX0247524.1 helix-turn-helix transcriptional regulator [Streptomyces drozdowiczii]UZK53090.1 helix-turn-helix transcriptional regulator [Streptomyces drozdowiczii]
MDNREEVREFLTSRRAKISPERAGLPAGSRRRVPGLRRSEVAALADVSVEYYSKLERGQLAGVSPPVLEAVARALQLDDAERAHLLNLARAADGSDVLTRPKRRRAKGQWTPHRSLQWMLDAVTAGPALVRNGRMDVLAANPLARAFYADLHADPGNQANLARFQFLDPAARRFYPDWERFADMCVPILRTEAGRNPHDKDLHDLVGELSTRSEEFRTRWGAHNVRHHGTGTKRFHHQAVGELTLAFEDLEMTAEPGLTVTVYTAEPGSPSEEGLRLLASWAATREAHQAPQHSP